MRRERGREGWMEEGRLLHRKGGTERGREG